MRQEEIGWIELPGKTMADIKNSKYVLGRLGRLQCLTEWSSIGLVLDQGFAFCLRLGGYLFKTVTNIIVLL